MPTGDHSMKKYDEELEAIRSRVLQMGGLVESQVRTALDAFETADQKLAQQAIDADKRVNELEMDVDQMVNYVIARRQPTAGDLRMITGVAKVITDLERIGDEASKIARAVKWLHEKHDQSRLNRIPDIKYSGEAVASMLRRALDAFARMDRSCGCLDHQGRSGHRRSISRGLAATDHVHDGRSAHDFGVARLCLGCQGDRAHRRSRKERRRARDLHLAGLGRAPSVAGRRRSASAAACTAHERMSSVHPGDRRRACDPGAGRLHLHDAGLYGATCRFGRRGRDAIDRELPDMVLLDWMLPDKPGIELLKDLRAHERTKVMPVIMLTAKGNEADKVIGLDTGADDYVVKPFSPRELVSRMRAVSGGAHPSTVGRRWNMAH